MIFVEALGQAFDLSIVIALLLCVLLYTIGNLSHYPTIGLFLSASVFLLASLSASVIFVLFWHQDVPLPKHNLLVLFETPHALDYFLEALATGAVLGVPLCLVLGIPFARLFLKNTAKEIAAIQSAPLLDEIKQLKTENKNIADKANNTLTDAQSRLTEAIKKEESNNKVVAEIKQELQVQRQEQSETQATVLKLNAKIDSVTSSLYPQIIRNKASMQTLNYLKTEQKKLGNQDWCEHVEAVLKHYTNHQKQKYEVKKQALLNLKLKVPEQSATLTALERKLDQSQR